MRAEVPILACSCVQFLSGVSFFFDSFPGEREDFNAIIFRLDRPGINRIDDWNDFVIISGNDFEKERTRWRKRRFFGGVCKVHARKDNGDLSRTEDERN